MTSILNNFYEAIRNTVNVSDVVRSSVTLNRKGAEFSGLCPFHNEKSPSFTVNDQKKFYHCFGCGAHGDVIRFLSETQGFHYKDAAYKLAEDYRITIPKFSKQYQEEITLADKLTNILSLANDFFLRNMCKEAVTFLTNRGINSNTVLEYNIGWAGKNKDLIEYFSSKSVDLEDLRLAGLVGKNTDGKYYDIFRNRIMIPIKNNFGKIVGFGGRVIGDDMPKYLNSPETLVFKKGETLFGENLAFASASKNNRVIVVEGYFDAISLNIFGVKEVVASLGTAVTKEHLIKLWRYCNEIIICLDGDSAGIRASKKIIDISMPLVTSTNKISFVLLPEGYDPDKLIHKLGLKELEKLVKNRLALSEFIWHTETNLKEFNTAEDRAALENKLLSYSSIASDIILKRNLEKSFKEKLWEILRLARKNTNEVSKNNVIKPRINPSNIIINQLSNLEEAIIGFIIQNISTIELEYSTRVMQEIQSSNRNLSEFIDFVIEQTSNEHIETADLIQNIKNSRFTDLFDVLLLRSKASISSSFQSLSAKSILEHLFNKRYLINLTNEYQNILKSPDAAAEKRAKFYLDEIRGVVAEIESFNRNITLSNNR